MNIPHRNILIVNFTIITLIFLILCLSFSSVSSASEINLSSQTIKKTDNSSGIILKHGIPQNGIFNNESQSHTYVFKDISPGQVVCFSIDPDSYFNVTLYHPSGIMFDIEETVHPTKYLGSWRASQFGDWLLQVNATRSENITYEILASIPSMGYSDESAIRIKETFSEANFTLDHEAHYWEVFLDFNQNGTLFLNEKTQSVLHEAIIAIYPKSTPNNPILPSEELKESDLPKYNFSWNALAEDDYIIKIMHKPRITSPLGLYNISFIAEKDLYSVETAGKLPYNQTLSISVRPPGFTSPKTLFFWFQVNLTRSNVFIRIVEENPTSNLILDLAEVKIYDTGYQKPILSLIEQLQDNDGEFNITQTLNEGKYYLVITIGPEVKGIFTIHFEYQRAQPFTLELLSIIISICFLFALPAYLIYLDSKGKWFRVDQWTLPTSLQETYKLFKKSLSGIFKIKEVPDESILIQVASIPIPTYSLINFIESSEIETLVFSKRINRRLEWSIYFLIGLSCFDFLNIIFYIFFSRHFLPFDILNLTDMILVLMIPTILLVIIVLFVNFSSYITYRQIMSRITYLVQNYKESSDKDIPFEGLDSIQANKNINYVRVLWNQAKHAFKEKNYELFVIKADASVKNLLTTRFLQIVPGNAQSKPDFQIQVTELRKRGFDLPSDRKIAHFRNLRNRIVHSSVTLDEKESVNCFAYYSTFITRLGLRPN